MVWRRSGSKVAPIAVDDYYNIDSAFTHSESRRGWGGGDLSIHDMCQAYGWRDLPVDRKRHEGTIGDSDARLTSKTLAGVLIKKLPPRTPFGPSLTLMVGIPSLSLAHVNQKPTPAMREMASSVVNASRILGRSAFAKSEGAIGVGIWTRVGGPHCEGQSI